MVLPVAIQSKAGFKLHIVFSDGIEGDIDLSHLKDGEAFKCWDEKGVFEKAYIDGEAIAWNEKLDIDALSLYLQITGQTFEQYTARNTEYA